MAPLPAMLAHVSVDLTRTFEDEARAAGEAEASLLLWSNLLRVVPDGGISVRDLPAAARISRRAVRSWLGLERAGWLTVDAAEARTKLVRLTPKGVRARAAWGDLVRSAETTWTRGVGATRVARLRASLEDLVGSLDLELPHHPMPYGTADASATGGRAVAASTGPPAIPAHGTDWVPVARTDPSSAVGLPLPALVSQALVAFTIGVEAVVGLPYAMATLLAGAFADRTEVALGDLPPVLGVSGTGRSSLERHAVVVAAEAAGGGTRPVRLAPRGRWVVDALPAAIEATVADWRRRCGGAAVDELVSALADVDARLPADHPDVVVVRFTPGLHFVDVSGTLGAASGAPAE